MAAVLEYLANGLFLGAIYALLAVPMSVIWATTDVIDVSIGGYAVVGGVVAVAVGYPAGPFVGLAAAIACGAATGAIFLGFNALSSRRDPILIVLATFAFLIIIESAVLTIAGTDSKFLEPLAGSISVSGVRISAQGILNLAISILGMAVLYALLKRSPLGLKMRACAISDRAATLTGIPVRRIQFLAFVVCSGVAGLAGILAVMSIGMTFASGFTFTTAAFSGAVLLGLAGPLSAFVGGILLGLVTAIGDAYLPSGWSHGVPSLLIILILASGLVSSAAFKGARP